MGTITSHCRHVVCRKSVRGKGVWAEEKHGQVRDEPLHPLRRALYRPRASCPLQAAVVFRALARPLPASSLPTACLLLCSILARDTSCFCSSSFLLACPISGSVLSTGLLRDVHLNSPSLLLPSLGDEPLVPNSVLSFRRTQYLWRRTIAATSMHSLRGEQDEGMGGGGRSSRTRTRGSGFTRTGP